ncbi:MAG: FAD-dependent thymidylate synthase [Acidobacteriota bacterium]|nr:FAD-dependent thymidylate synthase [Acidobacteriota bacterium]
MSVPASPTSAAATRAAEPEVYCIHGADPEVQAYAMAKYSRSALSMKQSLAELNEQKAEKFLSTFYFQYGHRSIADLAHLAMAIERLSLLAATQVVDETRWDGQERSTRYQDFKKSGHYTPPFAQAADAKLYEDTIQFLLDEYQAFSQFNFDYLVARTPKPSEMPQEQYERTLRARAFDISRYLLPLATNTSLGQIVNARTLETQVSRLLGSPYAEVRRLAELMKDSARGPAWDVNSARREKLVEAITAADAALGEEARRELLREVHASPTLVKYAEPNAYELATAPELAQAVRELMNGAAINAAPEVDLLDDEPLEIELATTLLYQASQYPYRQLRQAVESLTAARRDEIVALGTKHRGRHDELLRAYSAGQKFRFDILMDIGAYRDLHRHRRCVQIHQEYCFAHGFDTPREIAEGGHQERYAATMQQVAANAGWLAASLAVHGETDSATHYLLPLAYRKRTLFKMDLAEAVYISELRTGVGGHWSYRSVAYQMYEKVAERYPSLAGFFRVTDVRQPVDLLQR